MMKKKTYFFQTKLSSGEYVNIIYNSEHRRGTLPHSHDIYFATKNNNIELAVEEYKKDSTLFAHILNEQNMDEQCFDDYRTIDCR